jgi:type I restriction enzyme M protein
MLDTDTKRRIDTCRDILVGKVPDPKSQVEQITIALIYKFMDDMDAEAEELGGKRSFFAGEYGKYGWARLMAPNMGGFDVLALYSEAIQKMNENPGIPALFRDVFKNAYLPYRDPETLRSFLKEIDGFTYDHSERLGDAFEYLLSVLGSQGDAGQFRTPRHIIDFMVEVIDPKKNESVLDPACGTAGFLISAWKHILKQHSRPGNQLTPDERANLVANIQGYDISPDMVRLSLVNLYLHGFTDPHIVEYDTLTSEERWNETADIILANPPFMSPKGGIKPHKRFSVQATRSEVLFVDYMAEHLSPQGRAAIVVPEGIIFQSGTAYKALREMLVKNSLVAVVSLPAGVFNPYSGVKTSILILDKRLAKTCDSVLFVKVENDGYNLGAQRRAVKGSDLPDAKRRLLDFFASCDTFENSADAHKVSRSRVGEGTDWNLSGDRYVEVSAHSGTFCLVPLDELCAYVRGVTYAKQDEVPDGGWPVLRANNIDAFTSKLNLSDIKLVSTDLKFSDAQRLKKNDILICAASGSADHVGKVAFIEEDTPYYFGGFMAVLRCNERVEPRFLFECLRSETFRAHLEKSIAGANINNLKASIVHSYQIPLPPLIYQQEIVAEIERYQKIIDGARQVVENYQPRISVHPTWPIVQLSDAIEGKPKNGYSGTPVPYPTKIKVLSLSATTSGKLDALRHKYLDESIPQDSECRCRKGDIYLQRGNTKELVGTAALFDLDDPEFIYPDLMIRVRADERKILTGFLLHYLQSQPARDYLTRNAIGAAGSMPKINQGIVERTPVPIPDLETQRAIVTEIEAEQALVNPNRQLIERFEAKVKATINRVWGGKDPGKPLNEPAENKDLATVSPI